MKKISIMLLAALMLFAFVACDDKTPAPEAATAEEISLVADYINELNQKTFLDAFAVAVGETDENNDGMTAKYENGVYTVTLAGFATTNAEEGADLTSAKLTGTVELSFKDAEGNAVEYSALLTKPDTSYSIKVSSVKFEAADADDVSDVTISLEATGEIKKDDPQPIQYPANEDVTGLKVLFGTTEKSVSWADINAKIKK